MNITELCVNCKQNNSCTMCWKTSKKKCPHFIQKTNADRIRAMSDEELAYLIHRGVCELIGATQDHCETNTCVNCVLGWLKQPAE